MHSDVPTNVNHRALLLGQTVAVVGGSSGIGLAVAARAKDLGANLILIARDRDRLQVAGDSIGGARLVAADLSDTAATHLMFEGVGRLDHLVITAGTAQLLPLKAQTANELLQVMTERVVGPLLAVQAAAAIMPPHGSITLTSAQLATRPISVGAVMAGAVAAIEAITTALALELTPVRVNAVAPGMVDTPLLERLLGDDKHQVFVRTAADLPAKRVGAPDDVAQAVLFLMTNSFTTGEVLHVDGGGRWI